MIIDCIKALCYGMLEGITEWLPISSTGHLILLNEVLSFRFLRTLPPQTAAQYTALFEVVIQVGAILAVLTHFFHAINPFSAHTVTERRAVWSLWRNLLLASLPAAAAGITLDRLLEHLTGKGIDGHLFRPEVVAVALVGYGILFLILPTKRAVSHTQTLSDVTPKQALGIGCVQALALIPGTSRSGSTILGATLLGVSREAATEFSFLLGLPVIGGAALLQLADFVAFLTHQEQSLPAVAWGLLLLATAVSYLVSRLTIEFLQRFVKKHSFAPFGIYRIALGLLILLLLFVF